PATRDEATATARRLIAAAAISLLVVQAGEALAAREVEASAVAGTGERLPSLFVQPARVVLGRTSTVSLEIRIEEEPGEPPLRGSVNVGSLGEIEEVEPGLYRATYTPPGSRFPQMAVIALWKETGADAAVSFFPLPLLGTASIPVETSPGASITVRLAGRVFGPYEAGADGRVVARLVVPPGVRQAEVRALSEDGSTTSESIDLGVPPYNRLTLALVPHTVTADASSPVRLHIFYDRTGRRLPRASAFRISTPLAESGPVRHVHGQLYLAEYTAPRGTDDGPAAFRARLRGDRASRGEVQVNVGRQVPSVLTPAPPETPLLGDGSTPAELRLRVSDELGLGVSGLSIEVVPRPEQLLSSVAVRDLGAGEYALDVVPERLDPPSDMRSVKLQISAEEISDEVELEIAPWAPAELRAEPAELALQADGEAETVLHVRVLDEAGREMDHLSPSARASSGEIASITPAERGGHLVTYRAPKWILRSPETGEAAGTRSETLRLHAGEAHLEIPVVLRPTIKEAWRPSSLFVEASVGLQSNLGALTGPLFTVRGAAGLYELGPVELSAGIGTGMGAAGGSWTIGEGPEPVTASFLTIPVLAELWAKVPVKSWTAGAGLAAGLMFAPGVVRLPEAEPIEIGSVLPAFGLMLHGSTRLGPGRLGLGLRLLGARRGETEEIVDVSGSLGGLSFTAGYGVEL
ncbi:MAG: hypothetical protein ACOCVR_02655, partial [Myxococcota bacterium]